MNEVTRDLLEALNEIHNWLVCAPIATAEDMAESFPYMERLAEAAIARAEAALAEPQPAADGWIPWAGGDEPVGRDTPVDLRYRDSEMWPDKLGVPSGYCHLESSKPYWRNDDDPSDIIAYRIVRK